MDQIREQILTFPERGARPKPVAEDGGAQLRQKSDGVSQRLRDTHAFLIFHDRVPAESGRSIRITDLSAQQRTGAEFVTKFSKAARCCGHDCCCGYR